jgi:hypothetical protein
MFGTWTTLSGGPSRETSLRLLTVLTSIHPELVLNLENIRDGAIKIKNLKVAELKDLCMHFYNLIKDLEVKLKKAKQPPPSPPPPSTTRPSSSRPSSSS